MLPGGGLAAMTIVNAIRVMPELSTNTRHALREAMKQQGLPERFLDGLRRCYLPLAAHIAQKTQGLDRPLEVSINGPQGSGKSTLAHFLGLLLEREHGLASVTVSLDDLYLQPEQRRRRARQVHPLFATRGVPGTHDEALAEETFGALRAGQPVHLPRFDKAADAHHPRDRWPRVEEPVAVILFEGWCNHCPPQSDGELAEPINELERREDPEGIWRRAVNEHLRAYGETIFRPADLLLYLRIPSFDKVHEWRGLQERKLKQRLGPDAGMSEEALRRFIEHYERLTRHGMKTLPGRADAVIDLDEAHQAVYFTLRGQA